MKVINPESKSEVLQAFAIEDNLNAETLAMYLKRYPQFRESLIDLSIELFTTPSLDEISTEATSSDNAKLAWLKFQSMLSPEDPAAAVPSSIDNPLCRLNKQDFRELAAQLGINRLLLSQFRDNAILVSTIPQKFLALLAVRLHVSVEALRQILDAPPIIASGQRFKASGKPSVGKKVSFDDALANSGLSEEQQTVLKKMKD
ncbi:hypothetical protein [Pseudoalteromonas sp. bablab_jr004]|uniref:hypothetical protein n=1 Tax=Pseudoalteromonas sp. bablab_jr004 TaxID=2755065 RepID=UPI0018F58171|nr:hypothetical protein [Pseudoalteromonas sp. bablab_jr004]